MLMCHAWIVRDTFTESLASCKRCLWRNYFTLRESLQTGYLLKKWFRSWAQRAFRFSTTLLLWCELTEGLIDPEIKPIQKLWLWLLLLKKRCRTSIKRLLLKLKRLFVKIVTLDFNNALYVKSLALRMVKSQHLRDARYNNAANIYIWVAQKMVSVVLILVQAAKMISR